MRITYLPMALASLMILMMWGRIFGADGTLIVNNVTPSDSHVGAFTVYTFQITTSETGNGSDLGIPGNGWIFIEFTNNFDLSNLEVAQTVPPGMTGGFDSVKVSGYTVMLKRDGTGNNVAKSNTISFKVGNIINPKAPGTYSVTITTKTGTKTNIDKGTYNSLSISVGSLNYIRIDDAPNGSGSEVGNISRNADNSLNLYAVGYDAYNNYVNNVSVSWAVIGGIGNLSTSNGPSTILTLTNADTGKVTADDGSGRVDNTGNIIVTPGALNRVKIVEGESGNGLEMTNRTMTTDQSLTIHAAGYDSDGNYISDEAVFWSVTNGIGQFQANNVASTVFYANIVGTGKIKADHATATDDESGDITVILGNLKYVKIINGQSGNGPEFTTSTVQAGQTFRIHAGGYDANGNYISDVAVNWSVVNAIGYVIPSTSSSFTDFTGTTVGVGLIKADHATATDDFTDEITVNVGTLHHLQIRSAPNGSGLELSGTDTSLFVKQSLNLYAAGYDIYNNFVRNVKATWDTTITSMGKPSSLDYPMTMSGTNIYYNPLTPGSSGRFYADTANVVPDTTGDITIYDMSYIKLNNAPGASGVEVGEHTMTTDDSITLYAAAYDVMNNYLDTVTVIWRADVIDSTLADTSASFTFSPIFAPDTLKIYGFHDVVDDDSTGTIIIKPGVPSGIFKLKPNLIELSANGIDLTRITSDTITDGNGNKISSEEMFTISFSPKNLGLTYGNLYLDQDPIRPGHQVKSDPDGQITFEIKAGTKGGNAFISATSVNGTAYADTSITLSSIRVRSIDIDKSKVSQGQDSVEVRMLVENFSPYDITSINPNLKFFGSGNIKRNSFYEATWDSVAVIPTGHQKILYFKVNVANDAPTELVTIDGAITGLANGTISVYDTSAGIVDNWIVQAPPILNIVSISAPKDTVEKGTSSSVYLTVENIGDADAVVYQDSVRFFLNDPPFLNVTKEYSQVSIPSNPDTIYAGMPAITLSKSITVGTNATEGTIKLDGKIIGIDVNSDSFVTDSNALSTDLWVVKKKREISVVDFYHNQQSVILGQTTPWTVTMKIQNNFDTTKVKLDSARLEFFAGIDNITNEFIIENPITFEEFSKTDTLFADTVETLLFSVTKTTANTSGRVRIVGTAYLSDVATTQINVNAEDQINIQSPSDLVIINVQPSQNEVTTGQDKNWKTKVVVRNTGGSDIIIDFNADSTYLKFNTGNDFKIIKPTELKASGDSLIQSGTTDTLYFTIDSTGHSVGLSTLTVQLTYLDANALEDSLYVNNSDIQIAVQTPPNIRILQTVNVSPYAPYVNTNQAFQIRVDVENAGDDGVHGTKITLNSNRYSSIIPIGTFSIAGNSIDSVYFDVKADSNWFNGERFTATIDTATGDNTSEFDSQIITSAIDDTAIARIQKPAEIKILNIEASQNPVEALSKNWYITVNIGRKGAGAVLFDAPHKDSLKFFINGELQTDYFITAPTALYEGGGLMMSGWDSLSNAFVFTINQAGLLGGNATIHATLSGKYLNNDSSFVVKSTGNLLVETTAALRITKTEPLCPHIEDGVGILSTEQQFKVKVTVNNSGEEPVDSVWISLESDDPLNYHRSQVMLDSILSKQQKSFEFNALAKLQEKRVEFNVHIDSAKSRFSGGPALIGVPYDSIAVFQVQKKASLSLRIDQADSAMTLGQISYLKYIVENKGTAATENNGKVTVSLPPNYKIKIGDNEESGNVIVNFDVNQWDTLNIVPPNVVSENDLITVTISNIPKDLNTGYPASANPYSDQIIVKTVPSNLTIETIFSWPEGAVDGIVSSEQYFDIKSILSYSDNIKNMVGTISLPEGYSLHPNEQGTKSVSTDTVVWRLKAPVLAHSENRDIVVNIAGKVNGIDYSENNSIAIKTVKRSELHLENVGIIEPTSTDSTLSRGQNIRISATVTNYGAAVIGKGKLSIDFGATNITTTEDTIKEFTVGNPVSWIAKAPSVVTGNSRITIRMADFPLDGNANEIAYAPVNSKFFTVKTVEGGYINVSNFNIIEPVGAFNRILSTNQTFTLQAELSWFNCDEQPTASIELPSGFTTLIKDKYPTGTSSHGTVTWEIKAPSIGVSNSNIWVEAVAKDVNSGAEITINSDGKIFQVVRQAEITLHAEVLNNQSGVVATNQNFTIIADIQKSGGDAKIEDYYTVNLTMPHGEGYTTDDNLTQRLLYNETASWTIESPPSNRDTKSFIIDLIEAPHDENTSAEIIGDAVINDFVYLWIKTEEKSVSISTLPNIANNSVTKGDTSIAMLGLQFDCSGNEASNRVLFNGVRVKLKEKNGTVIENPQEVITKISVAKYMAESVVYGMLTDIPDSDSLYINFTRKDTLFPGMPNKVVFLVDIAQNARISNFQLAIDSSNFLNIKDLGSNQIPKILFNNVSSEEINITSNFSVVIPKNFDKAFWNYPNPFGSSDRETTIIHYYLDEDADIDLRIFTLLGELVLLKHYSRNEPQGRRGLHNNEATAIVWNGRNDAGHKVLNGVYLAVLSTSYGKSAKTKIAVLK